MADWYQGSLATNDLKVFYHRTGQGTQKPPIVLLHGYTDNGLCWSRVARDLEAAYDVIMPDARGHGHTEGAVADLSATLLAEDVAAIIQGLGLEKPFLFGHSMGASTALAVAENHPDLVRAALLEDPPFRAVPRAPLTEEEKRQRLAESRQGLAFRALSFAERLAQGRAANPGWAEDEIMPWAASKGEFDPAIVEHIIYLDTFPWRDSIARVTCPLLLITAEAEKGAIVTPAIAQEITQLCPHCEVAHIAGAAHCIHRDRYAETMRVVLDFLSQH